MEPLDWPKIAENIRLMRRLLHVTQAELAAKAGVDRTSVQRLERGRSIRASTLRKICLGLGVNYGEISRLRLSYGPPLDQSCVWHRSQDAVWHTLTDKRTRVPEDSKVRIQDPAERRRLGSLGLVGRFRTYLNFIMIDGPGVFFMEVYGRQDDWRHTDPGSVYEDWIMYCLRGDVLLWQGESSELLTEGSAIGFRSGFRFSLEAASDSEIPPQVMFIGANRR